MLRTVLALAALLIAMVAMPASAQTQEGSDLDQRVATFEDVAAIDELTDDHARVFRLYWAFFDREPDAEGALYWVDRFDHCADLVSIARFFAEGQEFQDTYGEIDDGEFVDLVYRNVLDRPADRAGRAYWLGEIEAGRMSRVFVMLHFAWSDEFVAAHPLPSDGVASRPCQGWVGPTGPREIEFQDHEPYAQVGPVTLLSPSIAIELIGFHQSGHDGAQEQVPFEDLSTPMMTMPDRNRDTNLRGAADIAVHPGFDVVSPVTGTVIRGGGYVLYCKHNDDFVVIEPDDRPGWEVKVLHIDGLQVFKGDRVIAGETVLAPKSTKFPFNSQIDEFTGEPSWAHVHIEVVDPSIPDRPSSGGGC